MAYCTNDLQTTVYNMQLYLWSTFTLNLISLINYCHQNKGQRNFQTVVFLFQSLQKISIWRAGYFSKKNCNGNTGSHCSNNTAYHPILQTLPLPYLTLPTCVKYYGCSCINIKNKDPPLQCTIKTSTFLLLPSRQSDSHEHVISCVNTIVLLNIMLPDYMALYQMKLSNMKIWIQGHITPIIIKVLNCYVSLYCNCHLIVKYPVKIWQHCASMFKCC